MSLWKRITGRGPHPAAEDCLAEVEGLMSESRFEEALELARRGLEGERGDAAALSTLKHRTAGLMRMTGDTKGARRLAEEALSEAISGKGERSSEALSALMSLVRICIEAGDTRSAFEYSERMMDTAEAVLPEESAEFAAVLAVEATFSAHIEEFEAAESLLLRAWQILQTVGDDQGYRPVVATNLAAVLRAAGKEAEALAWKQRAARLGIG